MNDVAEEIQQQGETFPEAKGFQLPKERQECVLSALFLEGSRRRIATGVLVSSKNQNPEENK